MLLRLCERLQHAGWVTAVNDSLVASVLVELAHYFGFFLAVGAIVMVSLRVLGIAGKRQSVTELAEQLFPLMWTGLGLSVLSGFILFSGDATMFFPNPVFHVKLIVLMLAITFGVIVQRGVRKWDQSPVISMGPKVVALVTVVLWIGVILAAVDIPHLTYVP